MMLSDETIQRVTKAVARAWGEDAAQHGVMRAWENGLLEKTEKDFEAYAYFCARNYFRTDYIKTHAVPMRSLDMPETKDEQQDIPRAIDTRTPLDVAMARQEIERLPFRDTAILRGMGVSCDDVATIVGCAPDTVKTRMYRMRENRGKS